MKRLLCLVLALALITPPELAAQPQRVNRDEATMHVVDKILLDQQWVTGRKLSIAY